MDAANHLVKSGVSFFGLKARRYSGDRVHAREIGYESAGQYVPERGLTGPQYTGAVRRYKSSEGSCELMAAARPTRYSLPGAASWTVFGR